MSWWARQHHCSTETSNGPRGLRSTDYVVARSTIETFEQMTGKGRELHRLREYVCEGAGHEAEVITANSAILEDLEPSNKLGGFKDQFDFASAYWMAEERISKRAINQLLSEPRCEPMKEMLSWKCAVQLARTHDDMGTKLVRRASAWNKEVVHLSTPTGEKKDYICYWDVESAARFLRGLTGFKDDLVYEPYCEYNGDGR